MRGQVEVAQARVDRDVAAQLGGVPHSERSRRSARRDARGPSPQTTRRQSLPLALSSASTSASISGFFSSSRRPTLSR